jgi:hypothetical protein
MHDCASCGTANLPAATHCWGCGRALSSEAVATPTPEPTPAPELTPTPRPDPALTLEVRAAPEPTSVLKFEPVVAPTRADGRHKCGACGTDNPVGVGRCWGCGAGLAGGRATALGAVLCLTAEDGRSFSFNIGMRLNQHWARALGEEARLWDRSWQMEILRRDDRWHVIPNPSAPNDTLLNGKLIETETALNVGDIVAVGRASKNVVRTPLTVSRASEIGDA